jgi:hypothetical protein
MLMVYGLSVSKFKMGGQLLPPPEMQCLFLSSPPLPFSSSAYKDTLFVGEIAIGENHFMESFRQEYWSKKCSVLAIFPTETHPAGNTRISQGRPSHWQSGI